MASVDSCRLCLAGDDLVWIFDEENKKLKMKDVISITTGIQIHPNDVISQKVCSKCYKFSIQIFQFRGQCLKTDKYLKGMCMDYLVGKKYYIPNSEVTIKTISKAKETQLKETNVALKRSTYNIHPSVVKLSQRYPSVKLPRSCLTYNISPTVTMPLYGVEKYFQRLKMDFKQCAKDALVRAKKSSDAKESSENLKIKNSSDLTVIKRSELNKTVAAIDQVNNKAQETKIVHKNMRHSTSRNEEKLPETIDGMKAVSENLNMIISDTTKPSLHSFRKRIYKSTNHTEIEPVASIAKGKVMDANCCDLKPSSPKKIKSSHDNEEYRNAVTYSKLTDKNSLLKTRNGDSFLSTNNNLEGVPTEVPTIPFKKIANEVVLRSPAKEKRDESDRNVDYNSLTNVGKSIPLFVCDMCNSVYNTLYKLTQHKNKHMRCQFCKTHFRSLKNKTEHIKKTCVIRKIMTDLPQVSLLKAEHDTGIVRSYPEAFLTVPMFEKLVTISNKNPESAILKATHFKDCPPERLDIIEILSDEDYLRDMEKQIQIIIPDINITGPLLTQCELRKDNQVLRELLASLSKSKNSIHTQTVLPTNNKITITDSNIILKKMLPYLSIYSIPVVFENGEFNVNFEFALGVRPKKKKCLWNDLIPVDIIDSQNKDCDCSFKDA